MVKINTVESGKQLSSRPTKTSFFIKFLIKICFLPITLDDGMIRFKLVSKKTMAHVGIYWGLLLIIMTIYSAYFMDDTVMSKILEQNGLEIFSIMSGLVANISVLFPILLAKGLNNMDLRLVWKERMPFPKYGVIVILAQFLIVIGFFGAFWGYLTPMDIPVDTFDKIASVGLFCIVCLSSGIKGITPQPPYPNYSITEERHIIL